MVRGFCRRCVDLTRIDGIDLTTALVVVSEIGADTSGKTKRCANRAAQALRLAVTASAHKLARLLYAKRAQQLGMAVSVRPTHIES
ncbi:hypothetical protein [uncultured Sphaerotilus sp.]|uniref:hypothetical protein n=1 Tax=uncultured Sphaerotilus sp. TaxID=474984 RepID=UPI0030CA384A